MCFKIEVMSLQAIRYKRGELEILDQLCLPYEAFYIKIQNAQDGWNAIKSMQVRGAPAIAIVAALSLAVYLAHEDALRYQSWESVISQSLKFLVTSRPTAVNLLDAARKLEKVAYSAEIASTSGAADVRELYIRAAEQMLVDDVQDNEDIGKHGAEWIKKNTSDMSIEGKVSVVTHCNTGSLATAGHGTALGVIRTLHAGERLLKAFYTETRPYNQGARLTGYELIHDNIPAELITDSMAAALFKTRRTSDAIACVVVGADRVAANGDTANKVGTYSLAILARYHGVKFLIAAPRTTIDLATASGSDIVIEERPMREVINLKGPEISLLKDGSVSYGVVREIGVAAIGTNAWNPSFDITPAELIDGVVTEKGVIEKDLNGLFNFDSIFEDEVVGAAKRAQTDGSLPVANGHPRQKTRDWVEVLSMKAEEVKPWTDWLEEIR